MPDEYKTKHAMRAGTNLKTSDRKWVMKTWGSQAIHNDLISRRYIFDGLVMTMAAAGQINRQYFDDVDARTMLFYATVGLFCHIGNEEDLTGNPSLLPTSVIRVLGNGALEECLKYYAIEQKRGELEPWLKTAM